MKLALKQILIIKYKRNDSEKDKQDQSEVLFSFPVVIDVNEITLNWEFIGTREFTKENCDDFFL